MARLPHWEPAARRLLADAAKSIQAVGWLTPRNLASELYALHVDWQRGNDRSPQFCYVRPPLEKHLRRQLLEAADRWSPRGSLGQLYADRARELALEYALGTSSGTGECAPLANQRFGRRDEFDEAADELSREWLAVAAPTEGEVMVRSDDAADPRSLLRQLREEAARQGLSIEIRAVAGLAALAATGPDTVYVVARRQLSLSDVARTVLHEIHGHALPQRRGRTAPLGLFEVGTARGADDQEGRALMLEDDAELLDGRRQLELALRHVAARSVEAGAHFVDTARALAAYPVSLFDRLRISARAHRGGGLARERVYLPAYLRVRAARSADAAVDTILRRGAVAVEAAPLLRAWAG